MYIYMFVTDVYLYVCDLCIFICVAYTYFSLLPHFLCQMATELTFEIFRGNFSGLGEIGWGDGRC